MSRRYRGPLTEVEVRRIRERYADGVSKQDLATSFRVCEATVTLHVQGVPCSFTPSARGRPGGLTRALHRFKAP